MASFSNVVDIELFLRIIPACAGSTQSRCHRHVQRPDHPRLRGEHSAMADNVLPSPGSSPPARGARRVRLRLPARHGIIPACAGSTSTPGQPSPAARDHPRLRGEHLIVIPLGVRQEGSSPPARGAHPDHVRANLGPGIIPACAGSTRRPASCVDACRDHPRLRGEHEPVGGELAVEGGSSPPARGARRHHLDDRGHGRIIPACAGSTVLASRRRFMAGDHPRLRGEHIGVSGFRSLAAGSSPPARGAPDWKYHMSS